MAAIFVAALLFFPAKRILEMTRGTEIGISEGCQCEIKCESSLNSLFQSATNGTGDTCSAGQLVQSLISVGHFGGFMSVSAVSAVLGNSKSKGLARLVFVCIAERMKSNGQARCSLNDIAKRAAMFSDNIPRLIRELEGLGELIVLKKGDSAKSKLYQISPTIMVILPATIMVIERSIMVILTKGFPRLFSPSYNLRLFSSPLPRYTPPPPSGGNGSLDLAEPKKAHKQKSGDPSPDFLAFWDEYPRHVAMKAAWKAWEKTNPPLSIVLESCGAQEEPAMAPGQGIHSARFDLDQPRTLG